MEFTSDLMENLDILCCGELNIDEISTAHEIMDSQASTKLKSSGYFYGGRGGNFCIYSSMFGMHVGIASAIGNDPEGAEYRDYLKSRGIDVSNIFRNKRAHTSKCFIFNDEKKTRIFFYGGALEEEHEDYIKHVKDVIDKTACKAIYCTSPDQEINKYALSRSRAELKVYSPSSNIYTHSMESIIECLGATDMLFLNQHESEFLETRLKKDPAAIAKEFDLAVLIKTLGAAGSEMFVGGKAVSMPAYKPRRVVDMSGAGDAYAGSFVANYLKTKDPAYSAKIASATASFVVEEVGCQSYIPGIEEIKKRAH